MIMSHIQFLISKISSLKKEIKGYIVTKNEEVQAPSSMGTDIET